MIETKEIYIGNGKTITVKDNKKFRMFDYAKINEYLKTDSEVQAGMKSDWFWTGTTLDNSKLFPKMTQTTIAKMYLIREGFAQLKKNNPDFYGGGIFHDDIAPKELVNKFKKLRKQMEKITDKFNIGGLIGSSWDTPILKINDKEINCFIEI